MLVLSCALIVVPNSRIRVKMSPLKVSIQPLGDFDEKEGRQRDSPDLLEATGEKTTPAWLNSANQAIVGSLKDSLSALFEVSQGEVGYHRSIAKFYALETVARVPYFSYTSVLHLYETVGHFRNKELLRMHFEESWNELHHLLIMEELGGDSIFTDRVIATHMAFFYYWIVVGLYLINPAMAYNFNFHVENHASQTYSAFLEEYADYLKAQPVPLAAKEYYQGSSMSNLYDVFELIRDDEMEHALNMDVLERRAATMFEDSPLNKT